MVYTKQIARIISQHVNVDEALLKPETNLSDVGVSSMDIVGILVQLEREFGVQIEGTLLEASFLGTIAGLNELIDKIKTS